MRLVKVEPTAPGQLTLVVTVSNAELNALNHGGDIDLKIVSQGEGASYPSSTRSSSSPHLCETARDMVRRGKLPSESDAEQRGFGALYNAARNLARESGIDMPAPFSNTHISGARMCWVWEGGTQEGLMEHARDQHIRKQAEDELRARRKHAFNRAIRFLMAARERSPLTEIELVDLVTEAKRLTDLFARNQPREVGTTDGEPMTPEKVDDDGFSTLYPADVG